MIEQELINRTMQAVSELYGTAPQLEMIQIEETNQDYRGDYTLVVFPLLKISRKPPHVTAEEIGTLLKSQWDVIEGFEVIKGFLNIWLADTFWLEWFYEHANDPHFGIIPAGTDKPVVIEYSSPNTNKPLHLGHIRNNLLGYSLSEILKANGHRVVRINLVNDRGIHICKSMLAWMKWGNGETPESSGLKGDHLAGKYYVLYDQKYKEEIKSLEEQGFTGDEAVNRSVLLREAKELLVKWEEGDPEVREIWSKMNGWTLRGFEETYRRMGIEFDEINYESEVYLEGKELVREGLEKGVFYKEADGSVWADLTGYGLDRKLLLRSDGTSVYITQDLGTAQRRANKYDPEKLIYVVGNEQNYHFDVLQKLLKLLGRDWADKIFHFSYGMVELPHGRMKSREGTVVDADDLMDEMEATAAKMTEELGKAGDFNADEKKALNEMIGLGALKFFILKVDPKKNMMFNPEESIDFNGHTGPFIQYTHARIRSLLRKSGLSEEEATAGWKPGQVELTAAERELIAHLLGYQSTVEKAANQLSPATIAQYAYDLARIYNHYYQDIPILKAPEPATVSFRLNLSLFTGKILKRAMALLGIGVPEKM
ncbi:MAG: arginine--tRNA ligase [Bacteroidales bacterium]